jgi:hypothetical protein
VFCCKLLPLLMLPLLVHETGDGEGDGDHCIARDGVQGDHYESCNTRGTKADLICIAKFRPEKYDFDLYKGFYLWKKNGTNSPDFGFFFPKSPDFYDKF